MLSRWIFRPFLGLNGLVQAVGPAAARLEAAGELVNDDHLAVANDVVLVALLHHVGVEGVLDVVDQVEVVRVIQVVGAGPLLHLGDSLLGEGNGLGAVVNGVVFRRVQAGHQPGEVLVVLHRLFGRAADDQGGAGLVDEDVVHLVDDGVVQLPLHPLFGGSRDILSRR